MSDFYDKWSIRVLSSDMLLSQTGIFHSQIITVEKAKALLSEYGYINFVGHSTIKILGIEPAEGRPVCDGYSHCIALKIKGRIDFGKEYTLQEIESQGYDIVYIRHQSIIPKRELMDINDEIDYYVE